MGSEIIEEANDTGFWARGTRFDFFNERGQKTSDESVVILKSPPFLRKYDSFFANLPSRNVVEVGIAEGGSLIYFALAYPQLRFVGIDLRAENLAVLRQIERLGLSDRIKLYYGVDQADGARINRIISENFGDEPLGAVMDDASHFYEQSKKTFEATFWRLAPGGTYFLEDWSWAHEAGRQDSGWNDRLSCANMLFELLMVLPSQSALIPDIKIDKNIAYITRGSKAVTKFKIDDLILSRGKKLNLI